MSDFLKHLACLIFDFFMLRKQEKKNNKITWLDIIIPPSFRVAIMIGIVSGMLGLSYLIVKNFLFKEKRTIEKAESVVHQLHQYKKHHSTYPQTLDFILSKPINKNLRKDAWGNNFEYSSNGKQYILKSSGKDELMNTEDDIIYELK